jgi:hypothetical protein
MSHRLTVFTTPTTTRALEHAAEVTGDTQTDTLNRAVQLYDQLVEAVNNQGARVMLVWPDRQQDVPVTAPEHTWPEPTLTDTKEASR